MLPHIETTRSHDWAIESKSGNWANAWLRGDEEKTGSTSLLNPIEQSVWIYSCITAIAEQIAHIPFRFSLNPNPDPDRDPNHSKIREGCGSTRAQNQNPQHSTNNPQLDRGPLVTLFENPSPSVDRFLFWDLLVSWLLLRGKACIVATDHKNQLIPILRPGNKIVPTRLYVLNPDRITKIIHEHELFGYKYSPAACDPLGAQTFIPEELLSIRLSNPFDHHEGLAPASIATLAAQTDYASAQFMKGLMLNNADTGLIVSSNDQLSPDQIEAIKAALRERKRKAGTADRPLFLWGNTKVEKPTLSAVDLQFLENRKFNRQEICSIFRVPQEILGFTEDANRSVAESARLNFLENRIAPLCERLAAGLSPILKPFEAHYKGNLCAWFDIESLPAMQKARRDRFTSARRAFDMGVPINVCNTLFDLGLPTNLPHAERSYLASAMQEITSAGQAHSSSLAREAGEGRGEGPPPNPDPDRNPTPSGIREGATSTSAQTNPAPTYSPSDISVHPCASVVEAPSRGSSENPQPSTNNPQPSAAPQPSPKSFRSKLTRYFYDQRKRFEKTNKLNLEAENTRIQNLLSNTGLPNPITNLLKHINAQTHDQLQTDAPNIKTIYDQILNAHLPELCSLYKDLTREGAVPPAPTSSNQKPTTT